MLREQGIGTVLSLVAMLGAGCGRGAVTVPATACDPSVGDGEATLAGLRDGPPRETPDTVEVSAWFRGEAGCGECPPEALCQPCVTMLLFSDTPEAPDAEWFWLTSVAEERNLREGCRYRLELALDEGYATDLGVHDNNPLYFDGLPAVRIEAFD